MVVELGDAEGLEIDALLNPVEGNQLYVVAPLALIGVLVPEQIVVPPVAVTTGIGFTVTVTTEVLLQPDVVPVTV